VRASIGFHFLHYSAFLEADKEGSSGCPLPEGVKPYLTPAAETTFKHRHTALHELTESRVQSVAAVCIIRDWEFADLTWPHRVRHHTIPQEQHPIRCPYLGKRSPLALRPLRPSKSNSVPHLQLSQKIAASYPYPGLIQVNSLYITMGASLYPQHTILIEPGRFPQSPKAIRFLAKLYPVHYLLTLLQSFHKTFGTISDLQLVI
jgi:hypothetical protein